jgi:hypothetical protein
MSAGAQAPGGRGTLRSAMLTDREVRARVRDGLETGRLWRLADDRAKLRGATGADPQCHVCSEPKDPGIGLPGSYGEFRSDGSAHVRPEEA